MKRFAVLFLPLILILLIWGWWNTVSRPVATDATLFPFIIPKRLTASAIADKLEREGFIRSSFAFRFYTQLTDKTKKIQAGDYRLAKNIPLSQLVDQLTQGPVGVCITLPEGMRKEEIGAKFANELSITPQEKSTFIQEFAKLTANFEGFLFPDTYLILKTATPQTVVDTLTKNFEKKVKQEIFTQAKKQNLTRLELITLASLVERETRTPNERPIVAGILLKRLKLGMPLQVDATLQYAVANEECKTQPAGWKTDCSWWEQTKAEDKKINSAYNTYIHRGPPPGPIANPGLSSIKAVANPQDSSYLYYLHDKEGAIRYASTLEEHTLNIQKYLQ